MVIEEKDSAREREGKREFGTVGQRGTLREVRGGGIQTALEKEKRNDFCLGYYK
jgi:hypothetical protein